MRLQLTGGSSTRSCQSVRRTKQPVRSQCKHEATGGGKLEQEGACRPNDQRCKPRSDGCLGPRRGPRSFQELLQQAGERCSDDDEMDGPRAIVNARTAHATTYDLKTFENRAQCCSRIGDGRMCNQLVAQAGGDRIIDAGLGSCSIARASKGRRQSDASGGRPGFFFHSKKTTGCVKV